MEQIIEQAAIAFANKCRTANIKGGLCYPYDEIDMRNAFEEGAKWQKTQSTWISVEMAIPKDDSPGVVQVRTVDGKEGEMAARRVVYHIYPYVKTGYITHWRVFN